MQSAAWQRRIQGQDYLDVSGTLVITPGMTLAFFEVPVLEDTLDEPNESVTIQLSNAENANLSAPWDATLSIFDNDPAPAVRFVTDNYAASEGDGLIAAQVELSAPSAFTITVDYVVGGGTTTGGIDYVNASGMLAFTPMVTSQIFAVTINDDALDEPDETIKLALTNSSGATFGTLAIAT